MSILKDIHAFIIDMDGVLWHGDDPIAGLPEFFEQLRTRRSPFILATNNARLTPDQYVAKLDSMGVEAARSEILTSGMATAGYLSTLMNPAATRVFVIGENGAKRPLIEKGFELIEPFGFEKGSAKQKADVVVCGLDTTISWEKLATATLLIRSGAKFVGTNGDTSLPTEHGVTHGNGAILAALQAATGIAPTVIGKPEPIMYQQAMEQLGVDPAVTLAIGDRLDTDILGAVNAGIRSLMVLTGISGEADLKGLDYRPTWIMPDIRSITEALKN